MQFLLIDGIQLESHLQWSGGIFISQLYAPGGREEDKEAGVVLSINKLHMVHCVCFVQYHWVKTQRMLAELIIPRGSQVMNRTI